MGLSVSEPPIEVGADDLRPTPKRSGYNLLDIAIALTAIFISAVSLFVAIEHGHAQRQLVAANSWPFLSAGVNVPIDNGTASLTISNEGTGPAKLEYVQFYYKNKPVSSVTDLMEQCCQFKTKGGKSKNTTIALTLNATDGVVLRPGAQLTTIAIQAPISDPVLRRTLPAAMLALKYKACYCSIFDECWISNLYSLHPQKVKSCPANDHPYHMIGMP